MSPPTPTIPTIDARSLGDRYQLLDQIGQGGMGTVFRARDLKLDRLVAVKLLPVGSVTDRNAVARFQREARALARLSHPNIIQAFDSGEHHGLQFLVMELAEGRSLAKELAAQGGIVPTRAADYAHQAAVALQHAHGHGLIHRDVKPSNLLLTPDGHVKLLDLGLARFLQDQLGDPSLTREGTGMGTPDYASPEQFRDAHKADARSDIYSLGCTLHHLVTGQVPFPGSSLSEKIEAHEHKPPPPLEECCPDLPPGLALVVEKMMAKHPEDRFQTMAEVAVALAPYAATSKSLPPPSNTLNWNDSRVTTDPTFRRRPCSKMVLAGIGAAVVLLLLVAAVIAGRVSGLFPFAGPESIQGPTPTHSDPGPTPNPPSTAPKPEDSPRPTPPAVIDDLNVLTVSQKPEDGGRFRTLSTALEQARPRFTIRVLDANVYAEKLVLSGAAAHAGITLEAVWGATLAPGPALLGLAIMNAPNVTVRGFRFRPDPDTGCLIGVTGRSPGVTLEGLEILPNSSSVGITIEGLTVTEKEPPVVVRNCLVRGEKVGLQLSGLADLGKPWRCGGIVLRDNAVVDCEHGILSQGALHDVAIVGNRIWGSGNTGLLLQHVFKETKNILIANNTFFANTITFQFFEDVRRAERGEQIAVRNNLILKSPTDLVFLDSGGTRSDVRGPGDGASLRPAWRIDHNWREAGPEKPRDKSWIPPDKMDTMKPLIDGIDRDAKSSGFLRPARGSPLATAGAGQEDPALPGYVGALPPEGIEPWDWERTWRLPKDAPLLTVSKDRRQGAMYDTITAALKDVTRPWSTIRVLDDATYEEAVHLNDRERFPGLLLEALRGATLAQPKTARIGLRISDLANVTVRGLRLRAVEGGLVPAALCMAEQRCPGLRLEQLDLQAPPGRDHVLINLESLRIDAGDLPVCVRNCRLSGGGIAVHLLSKEPSEYVEVIGNVIRDSQFGVRLSGPARHLSVVGNQFLGVRFCAISMEAPSGLRQLLIANNTFLDCATALRLRDVAPPPEVGVYNNLVLGAIRRDWIFMRCEDREATTVVPGDGAAVLKVWDLAGNWREVPSSVRDDPDEGKSWIPPGPKDIRQDQVEGLDRDPKSAAFLRPSANGPLATQGSGREDPSLPAYVGAVAPEGIVAWDWSLTWRLRLQTSEKPK